MGNLLRAVPAVARLHPEVERRAARSRRVVAPVPAVPTKAADRPAAVPAVRKAAALKVAARLAEEVRAAAHKVAATEALVPAVARRRVERPVRAPAKVAARPVGPKRPSVFQCQAPVCLRLEFLLPALAVVAQVAHLAQIQAVAVAVVVPRQVVQAADHQILPEEIHPEAARQAKVSSKDQAAAVVLKAALVAAAAVEHPEVVRRAAAHKAVAQLDRWGELPAVAQLDRWAELPVVVQPDRWVELADVVAEPDPWAALVAQPVEERKVADRVARRVRTAAHRVQRVAALQAAALKLAVPAAVTAVQ